MSGRGLVSYAGDSEISDEEEIEHVSTGHTPPAVALQGLGIPSYRPKLVSTTPPSFVPPAVQSAPLVAYIEDDEMNESRLDDSVFAPPPEDAGEGASDSRSPSVQPSSLAEETETDRETELEGDYDHKNTLFLPLSGARMPPEPPGTCSKALQDKVIALLQKEQRLGLDLNQHLQGRKDFRNPSIYEKLVTALNLDEFGTNFLEHLYDPKSWGEESNYKNLLEAQKKAYEKKEKAKLERTKIEFVKGTKRPAAVVGGGGGGGGGGDGAKKARKSKWDVSGAADSSGGSRGSSPGSKIGAQARAQATQLNKELSKLAK